MLLCMASEEEGDFSQDMLAGPDQMEEPAAAGNDKGKVRLILDKGWRIGKKIAITGVALSSAPILLPPLLIFSAFGLAFSVPFGLVFAGYACTDKIMRSLLPPVATASPSGEKKARLSEHEEDVPTGPEGIEEPAEKVEEVHGTEIYEEDGTEEEEEDGEFEGKDGVTRVDMEEDVREITEDDESRKRRLDLGQSPKDDSEQGLEAQVQEENLRDVNREEKRQQGEERMKEITKDDDDGSRLVVCETREGDDYETKQDAGGNNEKREGNDYEIKQDVGGNEEEEDKEMQGREVSAKQMPEADDYGVPSVLIVSILKEETPRTDSTDVGQLDKSSDHESLMPREVAQLQENPSTQDSSIPVPAKVTFPLDDKSLDRDMGSAEHSETLSKSDSRAASGKQQLESPTVEVSSLVSR